MIREGTVTDLDALDPLLAQAFRMDGAPYLSISPMANRTAIEGGMRAGKIALFLDGDPIMAFAWAERVGSELLVHQIYASPGHPFRPLWQAICDWARWRKCTAITGVTYKFSVARLFRRYGVTPVAILMRGVL